ncbi:MAG: hypothetical protein V3V03_01160 [Hyphomonadaceae bacterium]
MKPFARDIDTGIDAATARPTIQSFATLNTGATDSPCAAANDDAATVKPSLLVRRRQRRSRLMGRA